MARQLFGKLFYVAEQATIPLVVSLTTGEVIYANPACFHLFGAESLEQLKSKPLSTLFSEESRALQAERRKMILRGEFAPPVEQRIVRVDGTSVPVETFSSPVRIDGQIGALSVLRDITSEKADKERIIALQDQLVQGLIEAQERERQVLAYEIHDGLTQQVQAAFARLQAFEAYREEADLDACRRLLRDAVKESRRLVNGLHLLIVEDLGLAPAIEQLANEEKERANWENVSLTHSLTGLELPQNIVATTFRMVQEALTNARKYAKARNVEIFLLIQENAMDLRVTDDGVGFTPGTLPVQADRGVGLRGMAERARLLGGTWSVISAPGEGTTIAARLPLASEKTSSEPNIK
ncbi:MAG: PAS domain-containing sensor histidine kinase [Armatimonas sp.]